MLTSFDDINVIGTKIIFLVPLLLQSSKVGSSVLPPSPPLICQQTFMEHEL